MHRTQTKNGPAGEWKLDGATGEISGYASTFGNVDLGGDIVEPGAFTKGLGADSPAKVLYQHDWHSPIGITTSAEEDKKGLRVTGKLFVNSDIPKADEAHSLARLGGIDGLSIGYDAVGYEIDRSAKVRHLTEIKVHEWSLVTFPMNTQATITGVKSINEQDATLILDRLEMLPDLVGGDYRDVIATASHHLIELTLIGLTRHKALNVGAMDRVTVGSTSTAGEDNPDESATAFDVAAALETADSLTDILAGMDAATNSLKRVIT